jgi:peptide/nickel transport system permease protein
MTTPTGAQAATGDVSLVPEPPHSDLPKPKTWAPGFLRTRNMQLWIGVVIVGGIVAAAIAAPLLTRYHPNVQDLSNALASPGGAHLLGTDNLGRDIWSRLLYGARTDLTVTFVAVLTPFVVGTLLGALCGYFGGWFDTVVMRLADVVVAFPFYVLVIALVFALGSGTTSIYIAISIVSWVAYARIVRAEAMVLRRREFIDACRSGGLSHTRVIARHVLPNVVTQAIVYAMSDIVMNVGVIVTLSFFGLGIVPPTPDWGQMMSDGQQFLASGNYMLTAIPGLAVVITSLGLSFLGDGLANVLRVKR